MTNDEIIKYLEDCIAEIERTGGWDDLWGRGWDSGVISMASKVICMLEEAQK